MATSKVSVYDSETRYLKLAREIATDFYDIETVLKNNGITPSEFERIKQDARFLRILDAEVAAWNTASNTLERTKLKAGALIEEFLPEANRRIHDSGETLTAKTELVKTLARIAGMGERVVGEGDSGGRFTVTINLGADHKLEFNQNVLPQKVIEGEVLK